MTCKILKLSNIVLTLSFAFSSCTGGSSSNKQPQPTTTIQLQTERQSATSFDLIVQINSSTSVESTELGLALNQLTAGNWIKVSENSFKVTLTSSIPSGEVEYTVTYAGISKCGKSLILPTLDSRWNQPEPVPGFVNTDGWEDSPEISPDGKYLIVSTYSPISIFQCIIDGALAATPSCNQNSFATYSSFRPNFPGANRVISSNVINHTISLLDPPDTTNAFPPVSAYVFEKDSLNEFKNGKPIYIDWEAYTWGAPFGFTFKKSTGISSYQFYMAFGDPVLANGNRLQTTTIDFSSSDLKLGTISRSGPALVKSNWLLTPLAITGYSGQSGNPFSTVNGSSDGYLFWDNETLPSNQREIFFATESSAGSIGVKQTAGLANPSIDKYQPFFFDNRLYYSLSHGLILSQELVSSADLTQSSNWGTVQVEIGIDNAHSHSGRVTAIGEPSLFLDSDGKRWLYFAYSIQKTGERLDLNIARVREK